jgi:CelD/BcsL family acetyltransferase involved in cellulose biosynthesis
MFGWQADAAHVEEPLKRVGRSLIALAILPVLTLGPKPARAIPPASVPRSFRLEVSSDPTLLMTAADEWDRVAMAAGSPYCTAGWLSAWWSAFGSGRFTCLVLRDDDGCIRAGASCHRRWGGRLHATANVYTEDWDVVAADQDAQAELWRGLAGLGAGHLHLPALRSPQSVTLASNALLHAGYSVVMSTAAESPYLELPESWEQLLSSVSRKLPKRLRYYRRLADREGTVRFRTTSGGEQLERDLDAFLQLEGSGWKRTRGTAILSSSRTERLYREFARRAAGKGWLRLHLLELDGRPIAGDLGCSFAGGSFLLKTGFDEGYARLSPGLLLRAEALRAAIEEGSRSYDFLGGPDDWKLRWTSDTRPRTVIHAYRGAWKPLALYQSAARPRLEAAAARLRTTPAQPMLRALRSYARKLR